MKDYKERLEQLEQERHNKIDWIEALAYLACLPLAYLFVVIVFSL